MLTLLIMSAYSCLCLQSGRLHIKDSVGRSQWLLSSSHRCKIRWPASQREDSQIHAYVPGGRDGETGWFLLPCVLGASSMCNACESQFFPNIYVPVWHITVGVLLSICIQRVVGKKEKRIQSTTRALCPCFPLRWCRLESHRILPFFLSPFTSIASLSLSTFTYVCGVGKNSQETLG